MEMMWRWTGFIFLAVYITGFVISLLGKQRSKTMFIIGFGLLAFTSLLRNVLMMFMPIYGGVWSILFLLLDLGGLVVVVIGVHVALSGATPGMVPGPQWQGHPQPNMYPYGQQPPQPGMAPAPAVVCRQCGRPAAPGQPACQGCGAPLA